MSKYIKNNMRFTRQLILYGFFLMFLVLLIVVLLFILYKNTNSFSILDYETVFTKKISSALAVINKPIVGFGKTVNPAQISANYYYSDNIINNSANASVFLSAVSSALHIYSVTFTVCFLLTSTLAIFFAFIIKKNKVQIKTFSSLTTEIPLGVFSCKRYSFEFVSVGEGFLKLLDYNAQEINTVCNNNFAELIYQPDREAFLQSAESQLQSGKEIEYEIRLIKKDGTLIWVRNKGRMVSEQGIDILYCVAEDITKSKSHNKLNSANGDLKSIMDDLPGGIASISLDDNLSINMANASFYHLCGYTAEDFAEYYNGGMFNIIDNRDRPKLLKKIALSAIGGTPIITEFRIIKKDGKSIWLSMHAQKNITKDDNYGLLCVFTDISSLREAYNQAKTDREKARTLAAMATDIIFEYNIRSDELLFTGNRLLDLPQSITELSTKIDDCILISPDSIPKLKRLLHAEFQPGKVETEELNISNMDGSITRWYNIYAYMILDGTSTIIIGKLADITDRKRELDALIEANKRDPLTNLYNTSTTKYYIESFVKQLNPLDKHLHAFFVLDIDNFKNFNDVLGHAIGDSVLIDISKKIQSLFRNTDIIGRVGGDEFVLLIKDFTSLDQIKSKAQEICDKFENIYFGNNYKNLKLSVSIGISLVGTDGNSYATLFEKADKALYKVKSSGKNSYAFYSQTL